MYPENPEGTQVIVGSMNMEYISDTEESNSQPVPSQAGADTLDHSDSVSYIYIYIWTTPVDENDDWSQAIQPLRNHDSDDDSTETIWFESAVMTRPTLHGIDFDLIITPK